MRNKKNGVIYKGCFIPIGGGQNLSKSKKFMRDGMDGISVTLLANNHDAGVAVYVEDNGAWLCVEEPTERSSI